MLASVRPVLGGHLIHIVMLGVWPPIFGLVVLFERRKAARSGAGGPAPVMVRTPRPRNVARPGTTACQLMALASVCAALIHLAVMPDHFSQSIWYGLFFAAAAGCQLAYAALLLARPTRSLIQAGIAGSAMVVVLWIYTRAVGVPVGPDHGATEGIGLLDVLATMAELSAAGVGVLALRTGNGTPAWRWSQWSWKVKMVAAVCIAGTVAASFLGARS